MSVTMVMNAYSRPDERPRRNPSTKYVVIPRSGLNPSTSGNVNHCGSAQSGTCGYRFHSDIGLRALSMHARPLATTLRALRPTSVGHRALERGTAHQTAHVRRDGGRARVDQAEHL